MRLAAKLCLLLFIYLLLVFGFQAVTSYPTEGDSLAYHIPIAKSILDGTVLSPQTDGYALGFYPGSAEVLLSFLMIMGIPLNLYNVFAWIILLVLCIFLGKSFKLTIDLSLIYAVSITTTLAMVRLLTNQTIDVWLAVFFTAALLLIRTPRKSFSYALMLGISFGFLIGAKFSAPAYAILLMLLYGRDLLTVINPLRMLVFLLPVLVFGMSWYLRNFIVMGNPLYPQTFLGLPGNSSFKLMEWVGWKTIVYYPYGVLLMVLGLFSEFMLWALSPIFGIWYLVSAKSKMKVSSDILKLTWLGLASFVLFFFLPSTGDNVITYLRYLFPAFIPLVLVMFLVAQKKQKLPYLLPLAIINSMLLISFTPHQPKLFGIFLFIASIILWKYDILVKRLS